MSGWFVLSIIKKRNVIADVAWGLGFILMTFCALLLSTDISVLDMLIAGLVTVWGDRLAWHIHQRNKGKDEDYRYAKWRQDWGAWFYTRSYLQVYLLQGIFLFIIVLPVVFSILSPGATFTWLSITGLLVWIIGFTFEAVGDAQLATFLKDTANKGHLMQQGLWRYTRHPNYFGEVTQWWGLWLVALSIPGGLFTIVSPLTITVLILFVSGIPLLEAKMEQHPEFADYWCLARARHWHLRPCPGYLSNYRVVVG
jgi:steroid 5-alpha reductase family enzyme